MASNSRRLFLRAALPLFALAVSRVAFAAEIISPVPGKRVALSSYDPVSYFVNGRPEKGARSHWFAFGDAVYLFSSAKHRTAFAADPEHYAPQYEAYCTIRMSMSERAEADPEAWTIMNGKLYVFRSKNGVARFRNNSAEFVRNADAAWHAQRLAR